MDAKALIAAGYARTSNRYRMVSRIDRPDWKEHMASSHVNGMAWVAALGDRAAASWYRRCMSKDNIEGVPERVFNRLPLSEAGPDRYMEKRAAQGVKP